MAVLALVYLVTTVSNPDPHLLLIMQEARSGAGVSTLLCGLCALGVEWLLGGMVRLMSG